MLSQMITNTSTKETFDKFTSVWNIAFFFVLIALGILYFLKFVSALDAMLLIAGFIIIYKSRVRIEGFFDDYVSRESTSAINGIFIMLILFTHAAGYMQINQEHMPLLYLFRGHCRQLVVTTFLFYSGYGIMESIKKRGASYVEKLPLKRVVPLWIKFMIAVCIYAIIMISFGKTLTVPTFVRALLTWDSIGNSNWYVTAILGLYLISYISFRIFGKKNIDIAIAITFILTFIFFVVLFYFRGFESSWTYNTLFCFPAGVLFSRYKDVFESFVKKNDLTWAISLSISIFVFVVAYIFATKFSPLVNLFWYEIMTIAFPIAITVLAMKVKFNNELLLYMGGGPALFSIYIIMRVPMNIISYSGLISSSAMFFLISVVVTIPLAYVFMKLTDMLIQRLPWEKKKA